MEKKGIGIENVSFLYFAFFLFVLSSSPILCYTIQERENTAPPQTQAHRHRHKHRHAEANTHREKHRQLTQTNENQSQHTRVCWYLEDCFGYSYSGTGVSILGRRQEPWHVFYWFNVMLLFLSRLHTTLFSSSSSWDGYATATVRFSIRSSLTRRTSLAKAGRGNTTSRERKTTFWKTHLVLTWTLWKMKTHIGQVTNKGNLCAYNMYTICVD